MTSSKNSEWPKVKFGDVVNNVNATTKEPELRGLDRVVGLDHMDPESLPLKRWDELADLNEGTSFTRIFRSGQVLFGKRRAYQKKVSVPDFDGICSGDILVFEPSSELLLPDFLPYIVQSDGFYEHALRTSAGSLSPRTKWQELAKYEFVLPPVEEQRGIVKLLATVETVSIAYEQVDTSMLRTALTFEQLGEQEPTRSRLGSICENFRSSAVGSQLARTTPILGMEHMVGGQVWQFDVGSANSIGGNVTKFSQGDVLYGKLRPNLRKVAIATFDGYCTSEILALRPTGQMSSEILHAICSSDPFLAEVLKFCKGTKMPRVSPLDLLNIEVLTPASEAARAITERLQHLNQVERGVTDLKGIYRLLPHALRAKLITGTSQDSEALNV